MDEPDRPATAEDFFRLVDELPGQLEGQLIPVLRAFDEAAYAGDARFHEIEEGHLEASLARLRGLCDAVDRPDWRARLDFNAANIWAFRGRYDRAESVLSAFRTAYPDEGSAHTLREDLLAQLYLLRGAAVPALDVLRDAEEYLLGYSPDELSDEWRRTRSAGLAQLRGIRGEIYFQNGLLEPAGEELEREWVAASECGFADAKFNALLRQSEFATGTGRAASVVDRIEAFLGELGAPQDDEGRRLRALLRVYRGTAEAAAELVDATRQQRAAQTLRVGLHGPHLDHSHRLVSRLILLDLALRDAERAEGDLRQEALAEAETQADAWRRLTADTPPAADAPFARDQTTFVALETRLALLRGDSPDVLREQLKVHDAAYRRMLGQWKSFDLRRGGIGFLHHDDRRTVLSSLIDLILRVATEQSRTDGPARALEPVLAAHALTTLAQRHQAGHCELADVRAHLLDRGNGALVYVAAAQRTHLFVIDAANVDHHELSGRLELLEPIRNLRRLLRRDPLASPSGDFADQLARASAAVCEQLLPEPVEARVLGWTGVTVLGADVLSDLPFEVLALRDGRLLGEAVPVDSLSSFALGVKLAREHHDRPARGALRLAFVGTLTPSPEVQAAQGIDPIRFPRETVAGILACYGQDRTSSLFEDEATRAAFVELDLAHREVVHIVAHGLLRTDVELGRGLALGDAPLWHEDVLDALRSAPRGLVVISACSSGHGESRLGEGGHLTDLGGAFLWRGARVVALSQVDIVAGRHLRLMRRFHAGIARQGLSPAASMQRARAALADREGGAARFYFAQMQVAGLGQRPLTEE